MGSFPLVPEQASNFAFEVDMLMLFFIAVTVFFTVGHFHRGCILCHQVPGRRPDDELPSFSTLSSGMLPRSHLERHPLRHHHDHVRLGLTNIYFKESRPPDNALNIYVVGKQWMWKIQHPEGQREINELHVPAGPPRPPDH